MGAAGKASVHLARDFLIRDFLIRDWSGEGGA